MAKFNEMSVAAKTGILFLVALLLGGVFYYMYLNPTIEENKQLQARVSDKQAENKKLKFFEDKLPELNTQLVHLQQQLEIERKIVPDDKEADKFMKLIHDQASAAGIEIRRYSALPIASRQFVTEVPFQIDIDGTYDSVVRFFDRVAKLDRIINVGNLQMANIKTTGPAKVKTTYTYAPGESVVASCTATTFFSHDMMPQDSAPATPNAAKK